MLRDNSKLWHQYPQEKGANVKNYCRRINPKSLRCLAGSEKMLFDGNANSPEQLPHSQQKN